MGTRTDAVQELMKYKGNQVSPTELEAVIGECPGVADVGVISIPDGEGNDLPRAYVVCSESNSCTVSAVHEFVNKRVSRYKQLRGGVAFIAEIPRNTNGKIMRDVLKKRAKAEMSGSAPQPKL
jgi:4-coumarate--CoA ligase